MKTFAATVATVAGLFGLYVLVVWTDTGRIRPAFFDEPGTDQTRTLWKSALLYFAMVLGVIAGNAYSALSERKEFGKRGVWRTMKAVVLTPRLVRGLVASPIVFGVVYGMARGQSDIVLACVFSFENGFFCHLILQQREEAAKAQRASD